MSSDGVEPSAYRLSEYLLLLGDRLNAAQYHANRYQNTQVVHKREDALEDLREVRDLANEILDRYEDTDD